MPPVVRKPQLAMLTRAVTAIHRHLVFTRQRQHPFDVVAVFMRNENSGQVTWRAPQPRHTPLGFLNAETAIDQDTALLGFKQGSVSFTATTQRCEAH